ncbi:TPA: DUF4935 domain-containing protein [Vibrio parahaemolyticus]|nr:DUF4935 domain-containing protein [Vibrio parahaemolyticus]HCM0846447.1 DUF4935 domain-containing protein [Vibrio parahaemolyticus]
MKNSFLGFYSPNDDLLQQTWSSESTIFVFDTNVLLNLYGYAEQTRDDFYKIIHELEDKVWLPYQVGLEYQRRRLDVIKNEKSIFKDVDNYLAKIQKVFDSDFKSLSLQRRFPKLAENTEKLEAQISKSVADYKKSVKYWNDKQPCVRSHDPIREKLDILFDQKLGEPPVNQEWLDNVYKEGKERFEKLIPPGFKDAAKDKSPDSHFVYNGLSYERQYGDLILWKQIIEKSSSENIKSVVFVTDDSKEDWWYQLSSNGKKIVGPLAELRAEICREANTETFHMYTTSEFMKDGQKYLNVGLNEDSISDVVHVQNEHENLTIAPLRKYVRKRPVYTQRYIAHKYDETLDEKLEAFQAEKYFNKYLSSYLEEKELTLPREKYRAALIDEILARRRRNKRDDDDDDGEPDPA